MSAMQLQDAQNEKCFMLLIVERGQLKKRVLSM